MGLWTALKAAIDAVITTNGNNEITGAILNTTLDQMVDNLGLQQFKGIAVPTTNPGTPDGVAWYIATTAGSYINFGGVVLLSGQTAFFSWNGSAWNVEITTSGGGSTGSLKYIDLATEQIMAVAAGTLITHVIIVGKTGTTTVSVGTTSGGKEIMSNRELGVGQKSLNTVSYLASPVATNIYINVAGGEVDVTIISIENV